MDIKQFIQQASEGNAVQAKETLDTLLSGRAFEALDAKKQEIAKTLYGNGEDIEVQDTADTPMEDELLTQEEFDALSEEEQEMYLESLEQFDEDTMTHIQLKKVPGTSGKVTHVHYKGKKIGSITKNVSKSGNMVRDAATGKVRKATIPQAPGANKTTYTASHATSKNDSDWDKKEHAVQQIRDLESDVRRDKLDELSKDTYKKYLKTSDAEMKAHRSGSQSSRYADTAGNRGYKEAGKNNVQDRELNTQNAQKFAKKKLGISTTKKHTPI
jgi:hypothetical protein